MSEFFFTLTKKNLSCNNNSKNYCLFRCIVSLKMRYFPKEVGFNPIGSSSMTSKVKNGSIKGSFCWFKLLFHRFHFVLVSSKFPEFLSGFHPSFIWVSWWNFHRSFSCVSLEFRPSFVQVSSVFHLKFVSFDIINSNVSLLWKSYLKWNS